ncbi:MAG: nuclear transport factor 2 family protein [Gemmatimonadaceae bacterium]|nr:nuclear transport factor 2 family protein [Gemmatimonadaceae bacterium]
MTMQLPTPVAEYFATDYAGDVSADCFAPDAVVKDEGKTHTGRVEIRNWMVDSWEKYESVATPIAIEEVGGEVIVTANCVGNFPGSPLDLRFIFGLDGDKIGTLRVTS